MVFANLLPKVPQAAWLILPLLAWAVLLFGGFAFGRLSADKTRRMPAWTRLASSLVLAMAAWTWVVFAGVRGGALPLFFAVGMTLGLVGDLFMAHVLHASMDELGGIAAFGLGHVAYIAGMLTYAARRGVGAPAPRLAAWLVWLLVGLLGWYFVVLRGHRATLMHRAALPYALLLASTAGVATGLALQIPGLLPLALGGALFLMSDLLIAARLFNKAYFYLIDDVIWLTYGPAQMLLVYTAAVVAFAS